MYGCLFKIRFQIKLTDQTFKKPIGCSKKDGTFAPSFSVFDAIAF
jgi:hypothetical protein